MKTIEFSFNWNNKLDCKAFTTLRLSRGYDIDDIVEIRLKKDLKCTGKIVGKKKFKLKDINDCIAYIDTGYNAEECRKILLKMYKNKNIDWDKQDIYFYLIEKKL